MHSEKRIWCQFSLRFIIIFTVVASCCVGLFETKRRNTVHRRRAVHKITGSGGSVTFAHEVPFATKAPGSWFMRRLFGEDVSYLVYEVQIDRLNSAGSPDIDVLRFFPETKSVAISRPEHFSNETWMVLGNMPRLVELSVSDPPTPANLDGLKQLDGLRRLILVGPTITDDWLREISSLGNLENLSLGRTVITDAGLCNVARLPKLKKLLLESDRVTGHGIRYLARMPALEELELIGSSISNRNLDSLETFPRLRRLSLLAESVTDEGVKRLANRRSLRELGLSFTLITDCSLKTLADNITALEVLHLSHTSVTDAGLASLLGMQSLRLLDVSGTNVTDAGLASLLGMQSLRLLDVSGTNVTDAGVRLFRQAQPRCTVVQ